MYMVYHYDYQNNNKIMHGTVWVQNFVGLKFCVLLKHLYY